MDDLFGDLPPPSESGIANPAGNLYDDIPTPEIESKEFKKRKREDVDSSELPSKRSVTQSKFKFKGFVAERKGERDDMQDAHVILDEFLEEFDTKPAGMSRMCYYSVFDGHAGHRASQFAAEHLHKNIILKFPKGETSNRDREIKKCLTEAYKKTDDEFLQEASAASPVWKDGSTAVTALVMDDVLYVANLGDSKALLCRSTEDRKVSVVSLSKDHSPSQYEERMRIQKAGGTVREGRVLGVLEVSRSIGDGRFKRCGVTCVPDVMRCTLTDNDRFLLLACDGLWKGFSVDSALKFINNIIENHDGEEVVQETDNGSEDVETDPVSVRYQRACDKIASEAVRNGSSDNVTVMLVAITRQ